MLEDDLRGMYYSALKDLKAYYFKPPNISWGILFPFAFILAFAIRNPGDLRLLVPGLLALTLLFGTSSMEAIVIVFERRIGSLERLLLAPVRLPALLAGKLLGGMAFGLAATLVVLAISLGAFGAGGTHRLSPAVGPWVAAPLRGGRGGGTGGGPRRPRLHVAGARGRGGPAQPHGPPLLPLLQARRHALRDARGARGRPLPLRVPRDHGDGTREPRPHGAPQPRGALGPHRRAGPVTHGRA